MIVLLDDNNFAVEEHPNLIDDRFQEIVQARQTALDLQHGPVLAADLFSGMREGDNSLADSDAYEHTLDTEATTVLFGSGNDNLNTETLDVLFCTLIYSFSKAFAERTAPAVFIEGRGYEPVSGADFDLAETVGWITTLHPIVVPGTIKNSLVDFIDYDKNTRMCVPGKGRMHIASCYHSKDGHEAFTDHSTVELLGGDSSGAMRLAEGSTKEAAAEQFNTWWSQLSDNTITVFSDGSEQYKDGAKLVGYGYAIYRGQSLVRTGSGAINSISHVFDAEAIGALKGLQCALEILRPLDEHIWMCIDSTSVIWCMRANASNTSQWAFLECHALIDQFKVGIRWSPGHMGIEGNETADELADAGANEGRMDDDRSAEPTISGIGTTARALADAATSDWWSRCLTGLSASYRKWGLGYSIAEPPELRLPRTLLHRLLAARTAHGDFAQYHRRFGHTDAELNCLCGYAKTPEHLVFCEISQRKLHAWPAKPERPPSRPKEGRSDANISPSTPAHNKRAI
ncbi:hypothetical protein DID88_003761 [Monilinia fructigena]|uniref:RNase H type-1 domain-containing protein n=1 Tax=Monilinia fructigena TaxID=38457 RepID=A0A395ITF7_9HELO|nr:hypothetical protein DID88_003761 [Monilinia fructigena]